MRPWPTGERGAVAPTTYNIINDSPILCYSKFQPCWPKHVTGLICNNDVRGTAVAQWLRRCATNRKVVGSIPAGDIGIFH